MSDYLVESNKLKYNKIYSIKSGHQWMPSEYVYHGSDDDLHRFVNVDHLSEELLIPEDEIDNYEFWYDKELNDELYVYKHDDENEENEEEYNDKKRKTPFTPSPFQPKFKKLPTPFTPTQLLSSTSRTPFTPTQLLSSRSARPSTSRSSLTPFSPTQILSPSSSSSDVAFPPSRLTFSYGSRKSARKTRKSVRKTRKSARKTRKSTRKSRKSVRTNRKSISKTSRQSVRKTKQTKSVYQLSILKALDALDRATLRDMIPPKNS